MQLKDIYAKPIERKVNPAVSVTLLDDKETTDAEIKEYVFTDEIINGLYRILNSIRENKSFHHVGIWIDGYYGSGKSHFLKYLDYCIDKRTQEVALARLSEAVNAFTLKHPTTSPLTRARDSFMCSGISLTVCSVSIRSTSGLPDTLKSLC